MESIDFEIEATKENACALAKDLKKLNRKTHGQEMIQKAISKKKEATQSHDSSILVGMAPSLGFGQTKLGFDPPQLGCVASGGWACDKCTWLCAKCTWMCAKRTWVCAKRAWLCATRAWANFCITW